MVVEFYWLGPTMRDRDTGSMRHEATFAEVSQRQDRGSANDSNAADPSGRSNVPQIGGIGFFSRTQ